MVYNSARCDDTKKKHTSQTLSPRNASDAAFQNFRGAFPFRFGGGGRGDAAVLALSAEHRQGLKVFKEIAFGALNRRL